MVFFDFLTSLGVDPVTFYPFDLPDSVNAPGPVNDNETMLDSTIVQQPVAVNWPTSDIDSSPPDPGHVPGPDHGSASEQVDDDKQKPRACIQCEFCKPYEDFEYGSGKYRCSAKEKMIDNPLGYSVECKSYYPSEDECFYG